MLQFEYATLTGDASWRGGGGQRVLRDQLHAALDSASARLYAAFAPQFGLASDQFVVISCAAEAGDVLPEAHKALAHIDGVADVSHHGVEATARPTSSEPLRRHGVYVHRFFDLHPERIDEAVELSARAWESFERVFEVEIAGLFRTLSDDPEHAQLMLLNWYPSLAAWEASRDFERDPESRKRFARRAELTERTRAITTLLLEP